MGPTPRLLAMVGFQRVYVHQWMNAFAMEYQILVHWRCFSFKLLSYLTMYFWLFKYKFKWNLWYVFYLQDGDIINIDVTVYLNVSMFGLGHA